MDQDPPQARTTNPRDTRTGPCPSHTAMDTAASRPSYGRRRPVGQNPFTESKPYAEPGSHAADHHRAPIRSSSRTVSVGDARRSNRIAPRNPRSRSHCASSRARACRYSSRWYATPAD